MKGKKNIFLNYNDVFKKGLQGYQTQKFQFDYSFSGFLRSTNIIGAVKQGFRRINKVGTLDSRRQNSGSSYLNNII